MSRTLTKRKLVALIALGLALLLAVAWVNSRRLTRFLDHFVTTRERSLPATQFGAYQGESGTYQGGGMLIGKQEMSNAGLDFMAYPLTFRSDPTGQLVLSSNGKSFVLGPLTSNEPGPGGIAILRFAPDPGDKVSFEIDHSILGWPTPFRLNFMTGAASSSWARAVYYRLSWRKPNGASLEMVWTYDQEYS